MTTREWKPQPSWGWTSWVPNGLLSPHLQMFVQSKTGQQIIEFGCYHGRIAAMLGQIFPNRRIFTIDHFKGLEATKKHIPILPDGKQEWPEGIFKTDKAIAERVLEPFPNVTIIDCDVHKLAHPDTYNMQEICCVNVDVDIYEPTVSALKFLNKCKWSNVFIRFDDWHAGESQYDEHERLAWSEWIAETKYDFQIVSDGFFGEIVISR